MNISKTVFISSNDFNVPNFKIISLYEMSVSCAKTHKRVNFGINNNFAKGACRISIGLNMDILDSPLLKVSLQKVW